MDALAAAFLWLIRSLRHNYGTLRYLVREVKGGCGLALETSDANRSLLVAWRIYLYGILSHYGTLVHYLRSIIWDYSHNGTTALGGGG
jgi:hypothetical protein